MHLGHLVFFNWGVGRVLFDGKCAAKWPPQNRYSETPLIDTKNQHIARHRRSRHKSQKRNEFAAAPNARGVAWPSDDTWRVSCLTCLTVHALHARSFALRRPSLCAGRELGGSSGRGTRPGRWLLASLLGPGARTLLRAPGIATSNKKTTSNKKLLVARCIATRNKCIATCSKKLLVTRSWLGRSKVTSWRVHPSGFGRRTAAPEPDRYWFQTPPKKEQCRSTLFTSLVASCSS